MSRSRRLIFVSNSARMKYFFLLLIIALSFYGCQHQPSADQAAAAHPGKKQMESIGLEYALETQKVLGKNLMQAIQSQGALHALEFCNIRAIPLTDSMAQHYATSIRRVSDKPRNPDNQANAEELKYIEQFKKQVAAGQYPLPVVLERQGIAQFYYPIVTNSMCLQCHGKSTELKPEVAQKIRSLYPADKATGYSENEVRGIWSVGLK